MDSMTVVFKTSATGKAFKNRSLELESILKHHFVEGIIGFIVPF